MSRKERPIIIDLGERHRSDIRDLKRGEGELAYEIDRVIDRVTHELGLGGQSGQSSQSGQGGQSGRSASVSVGTTGSSSGTTGSGSGATGSSSGTTGSSSGTTGSSKSVGFEVSTGGGQANILPVIVLYSKKGGSRRDDGIFSFIPMMGDDDDDDRDRD